MARRNSVVALYRDGLPTLLHMFGCAAHHVATRTVSVLCAACHARAVHALSPGFLRETFTLSMTLFLKQEKRAHQPIRPTMIINPSQVRRDRPIQTSGITDHGRRSSHSFRQHPYPTSTTVRAASASCAYCRTQTQGGRTFLVARGTPMSAHGPASC